MDVDFGGGSNTLTSSRKITVLRPAITSPSAATATPSISSRKRERWSCGNSSSISNSSAAPIPFLCKATTFPVRLGDQRRDNSFAVTQTETLITSQELSWRGDQGTAAFDFTGASEIALATVVDGLRTTLSQRFESADQASVTATLLGNDNTLALSAVNVSVLSYLIAVNGVSNLLSLSAENASNARLDLEVLGNRNTISTLQRDVSDASIQVRLSGSDNQLTIEQSATPGL